LCGRDGGVPLLSIAYADVWSRLQHDWGVALSPAVRHISAQGETATLVRCPECGLERFEPMTPGGPEFYAELSASLPFVEERWDFAVARDLIAPPDDVVDLGCGEGHFLRSLEPRTGRTVGVDHNAEAIRGIVARGGEAYAVGFEVFAEREAGAFDVVTTFHTVEHVDDPVGTIRAAAGCLRPGGRMLVSLPNRMHVWRDEGAPLDRPPHHVTRWEPRQVALLASRAGMDVVRIRYEEPHVSARALARRALGVRSIAGARLVSRIGLARIEGTVRSGSAPAGDAYAARGIFGHTMLAELRRR
jgi:SAM-dependent methyltransferase